MRPCPSVALILHARPAAGGDREGCRVRYLGLEGVRSSDLDEAETALLVVDARANDEVVVQRQEAEVQCREYVDQLFLHGRGAMRAVRRG